MAEDGLLTVAQRASAHQALPENTKWETAEGLWKHKLRFKKRSNLRRRRSRKRKEKTP